jgi:hypothetical protein
MTSRDFCFWLQGYFEIGHAPGASGGLNAQQVDLVKRHLALVFKHEIDPSMGPPEHQAALDATHNPDKPASSMPSQIGGVGPGGIVYRC